MNTITIRKCLRVFALFCLFAGMVTGAVAQSKPVQFPASLKWQMMHYASFNYPPDDGQIDPNIKAAAYQLWKSELDALQANADKLKKMPNSAFVLVSAPYRGNNVLSMISTIGSCITSGNGAGMVDMYYTCPMTVFQIKVGATKVNSIPDMCFLHLATPDHPAAKNHTEFAFDEAQLTAYFRIIQNGKEVPNCNRAVRLQ